MHHIIINKNTVYHIKNTVYHIIMNKNSASFALLLNFLWTGKIGAMFLFSHSKSFNVLIVHLNHVAV